MSRWYFLYRHIWYEVYMCIRMSLRRILFGACIWVYMCVYTSIRCARIWVYMCLYTKKWRILYGVLVCTRGIYVHTNEHLAFCMMYIYCTYARRRGRERRQGCVSYQSFRVFRLPCSALRLPLTQSRSDCHKRFFNQFWKPCLRYANCRVLFLPSFLCASNKTDEDACFFWPLWQNHACVSDLSRTHRSNYLRNSLISAL